MATGGTVGPDVDVTLTPAAWELVAEFDAIGVELDYFKDPLTRSVREVMVPSIQKNFDMGGRPAWEPLDPLTIQDRRYKGFEAGPILSRTSTLMRQATQINMWSIDQEQAGASIPSLPYAAIQEFGGAGGKGSMLPARSYMDIQDEDMDAIENIFLDWAGDKLDGHGFSSVIGDIL